MNTPLSSIKIILSPALFRLGKLVTPTGTKGVNNGMLDVAVKTKCSPGISQAFAIVPVADPSVMRQF